LCLVTLTVAVSFSLGCQSWGEGKSATKWWSKSKEPLPPDAAENFGEPVKMDIAWKDDTLPGPDGELMRGIGGRVHFLDKNGKAIRVHGSLTVYGFDEQNGQVTSPRPDKRFHFKDEELQSVYSTSTIGHSYNVWIPWEGQGYQKHIAVLPIFRGPDGRLLKGDHAQAVLHGQENPSPIVNQTHQKTRRVEDNRLVERVVYQTANPSPPASPIDSQMPDPSSVRVKTINVPDSASSIRDTVKTPVHIPERRGRGDDQPNADLEPAASSVRSNNSLFRGYEIQPYQPGRSSSEAAGGNGGTQPSRSNANWNRAMDQFMRTGPRKNSGITAFPNY
jgi:hypothetical protein